MVSVIILGIIFASIISLSRKDDSLKNMENTENHLTSSLDEASPDEALMHLEKAIAFGDKTAHTQIMIARIYESRGDKSRALKHYKKALEYEPRDDYIFLKRIKEWEEAGIKAEN